MGNSFERILENAPDGVVRLDSEGRILYLNPCAAGRMGMERDEVMGKTYRELAIPETLAEEVVKEFRRALERRTTVTRTFHHEGSSYEARMVPELDERGRVVSVLVFSRDVSDRERLSELLRKERNFAEDVIVATREPMLVVDKDLNMRSANTAFLNLFSCEQEEITGRGVESFLAESSVDTEELRKRLLRILETRGGMSDEMDLEIAVPESDIRSIHLQVSQIDHLQLLLLAFHDVTEQKKELSSLEQDLRRRNEELTLSSQKLRKLLVELSETEDRERRRLAELLHDDVQQLLAGVGFHLRMARKEAGGEETKRLLDEADTLLKESIRLTRDLSHELSPASLQHIGLSKALERLAGVMKQRYGLEVSVSVEGEVDDLAAGIRTLLYKAVMEMLFNIVKHARVNEAGLEVKRTSDAVVTLVKDHGKGFDTDAVLNRSSGEGLGLLSIQERLASLGGSLEVESLPGSGSRFHLTVPIQEGMEEPEASSENAFERALLNEGGREPVRVVLVDDHNTVREALANHLSGHPRIEVVGQAENGRAALTVVADRLPDLVLMDLAMPEMNGAEAARRIKASHPDIRVVGLSMFQREGMEDELRNVGMDGFLPKTSLLSELYREIFQESEAEEDSEDLEEV